MTERKYIIKEKPMKDFSSLVNFNNWFNKKFTITKKIAKHGNQAIIVIPRVLESQLKPGVIVRMDIEIMEDLNGVEKK